MKKVLSVLLAVVMCALMMVPAFAVDSKKNELKFHDGEFRIMQLNDTQDVVLKDVLQRDFFNALIEQEKPDLIVFAGDLITDFFPGASRNSLEKCVANFFPVVEECGVPFVITFGNHDHDWDEKGKFSLAEQMAFYKQFDNCIVPDDGYNLGTFNLPIKSSDGSKTAFNVYVFDSNNKAPEGVITGYEGVRADQVEWYKAKSDELKAANGGKVVPSLVFQHVPMKEIYQFLDVVPFTEDLSNAVYNIDNNTWYVLNDKATSGVLGEVPCSESQDSTGGQYDAMIEKGDIVGAFFAHDHVNNFMGVTDEGMTMGYNGGTGFSTYGRGGDRSARMFIIDENDPENYETYLATYNETMGKQMNFWVTDIISPVDITLVFKFLVSLIPDFVMDIIRMFM